MAELYLVKRMGILQPMCEGDMDVVNLIADGEVIRCEFSRPRNYKFLKKYFVLLDVLYNCWEAPSVTWINKDRQVIGAVKNRDRFRKDITIATGHYEIVVNIKGEAKAEAKSISFAKMDEIEFSQLYSSHIDYALQKISGITTMSRKQIDEWVQKIMDFT